MQAAILDLGTNTFHLSIVENGKIIFKTSKAAKIGLGGLSEKKIQTDAFQRGLDVLTEFKAIIDSYSITLDKIKAIGTSALRNAENGQEFCAAVMKTCQIPIEIIDGNQEADYIYHGVKNAVSLEKSSLIMDIGGGSVEFIIADNSRKYWQNSFEIGGLRLMEKFMTSDPIPYPSIEKLHDYAQSQLIDLHNAIHQFKPEVLVGSSGSFDTLIDIYYHKLGKNGEQNTQVGFDYPLSEFYSAYEALVFNDRKARIAIPGMIELRVDMIVVACILIHFIQKTFSIQEIKVSKYSLLEGVFYKDLG
ncbi:MAG: phosphatase [Leadbetterella sp.]